MKKKNKETCFFLCFVTIFGGSTNETFIYRYRGTWKLDLFFPSSSHVQNAFPYCLIMRPLFVTQIKPNYSFFLTRYLDPDLKQIFFHTSLGFETRSLVAKTSMLYLLEHVDATHKKEIESKVTEKQIAERQKRKVRHVQPMTNLRH